MMKRTNEIRILVLLFAMSIFILLVGCGENTISNTQSEEVPFVNEEGTSTLIEDSTISFEDVDNPSEETESEEMIFLGEEEATIPSEDSIVPIEDITDSTMVMEQEETTSSIEFHAEEATQLVIPPQEEVNEMGLTEKQRNSFSMLYYLAITAEEIRISKDNRLILDDIYTSLLNDINPGAIDEITQDHLTNLRDIIKSYQNISIKRDRLQYIYNQNKAVAIRSAVPNPLAILSVTNSFNWKKLVASVVYTSVDSYNNYKGTNEAIDQEFLLSGWELDDEETETIQKNRERAFDYMVDIVQEYDLDGKMTLNEKAIETFAEICAIESVQQKVRRLESEEETYKLLGNYWLELADCYYETSQYRKCLNCVDKYNELATGIYRKDYNYVQILPEAIVAAQETYYGDAYISNIEAFADDIIENTSTEDWSIRYFVAQVYLDLYARTDDREYLEAAYNIAYDNVTILLEEQQTLNITYLEDVKELEIEEPDYRFLTEEEKKEVKQEYKDEQKRLKAYNKAMKEKRKVELPPLYEPLILNCDLLFALAEEMHINNLEMKEIEDILQTDINGVFLTKPINEQYSFSTSSSDYSINFSKDKIVIPVDLMATEAEIVVLVIDNNKTVTFDDCTVTKVEREKDTIESFYAYVSSDQMKDYEWTEDSKAIVKIINNDEDNPLIFRFKVAEYKARWPISDKVVFEKE